MPRLTIGSHLAAALLLLVTGLAAGCNDSTTTPTTPTNPVSETLTGTITQNGVSVQPFNAAAAGTVIATVTTLAPSSSTVGFSMGTYSGTTCQVVLDNPAAVQGSILWPPFVCGTAGGRVPGARLFARARLETGPVHVIG